MNLTSDGKPPAPTVRSPGNNLSSATPIPFRTVSARATAGILDMPAAPSADAPCINYTAASPTESQNGRLGGKYLVWRDAGVIG
jgi:hypothetical protein